MIVIVLLLLLLSVTVDAIAIAGGVLTVALCPIMARRMMVVMAGYLVLVMVRGRDGGGRRGGRIGWWRVVVDDDDLLRLSVLVELCPVCRPLPRTRGGHSCAAQFFFLLRTMVVCLMVLSLQESRFCPSKGDPCRRALWCFLPVFLPLVLSSNGKQSGMGPVRCSSGKKRENK